MTDMTIRRDDDAGRYIGRLPDGEEATLEFEMREPGVIELERTYVPESRRRSGLGRRLVRHVLEDARSQGMKVIPTCPFVSRVLAGSIEFQELVVGERTRA